MSKLKTALDLVPEKIQKLIKDYAQQIEDAWLKREEDEGLTISFATKFFVEKGANVCDVSIAFTPEKIKDHTKFVFDNKQGDLFSKDKTEPVVDEAGDSLKKEIKKAFKRKGLKK